MKAFPNPHAFNAESAQLGMDLRDYFAAQALTGAQIWDAVLNGRNPIFAGGIDELAKVAYSIADAMMEARNESL